MSDGTRKWVLIGGIATAAIFASVSGWNGFAVSRSVAMDQAIPDLVTAKRSLTTNDAAKITSIK